MSETPGILVIGGGIAGIQAALDTAEQGVNVYLVEQEPSIGGHMAMLDKTFPTLDCSACILTPKMVEVARHPNIELLTYAELQEVKRGEDGFKVKILKKPRFVDEIKCTGCGVCAQHCPIEVPNEFEVGLSVRKAIYVPFPQAVPLKYTIDDEYCIKCGLCQRVCKAEAVNLDQRPEVISLTVGAIIVATGFKIFDAKKRSEYGYGRHLNVITSLELERLINASGPTGGHVLRLSDGRIPRRVAFIQCVGSRDQRAWGHRYMGNPYCSRVCCMYAIKNGVLLKEHVHDVDVTIFYTDIRTIGKGSEEFYQRAREEFNVHFVRGRVAKVIEIPETKNLLVRAEDTETGKAIEREFDMVVLSVGLMPSSGIFELSEILDIPIDEHGFPQGAHFETDRFTTGAKGIFVVGAAQGPKDIPDSVIDASAAAMKAAIFLTR